MIDLFKKPPKQVTRLHPDLKRLTQKAFTLKDGKKKISFYEFKEIYDMPIERYDSLNKFIEDHSRGMTKEEGLHWCKMTIEALNKNNLEGQTDALSIQKYQKYSYEIAMNIDLMMRLLSCVFFFIDENLLKYDDDIGDYKIDLFKKHGLMAFFLSLPIRKYLQITKISLKDMEILLKQRETKKEALKELSILGISTTITSENETNPKTLDINS